MEVEKIQRLKDGYDLFGFTKDGIKYWARVKNEGGSLGDYAIDAIEGAEWLASLQLKSLICGEGDRPPLPVSCGAHSRGNLLKCAMFKQPR